MAKRNLNTLVREIARHWPGWKFQPAGYRMGTISAQLVEKGSKGKPPLTIAILAVDLDRILVYGLYPHDKTGVSCGLFETERYLEIDASVEPRLIAQKIQRRFLPRYRGSYEAALSLRDSADCAEHEEQIASHRTTLLKLLGQVGTPNPELLGCIDINKKRQFFHFSGALHISHGASSKLFADAMVDLNLQDVPLPAAKAICKLLKKLDQVEPELVDALSHLSREEKACLLGQYPRAKRRGGKGTRKDKRQKRR